MLRLFIAILLPEEIREKIQDLIDFSKDKLKFSPINWVKKENLHLTLRFIGEVNEAQLNSIYNACSNTVSKLSTFYVKLGSCGAFPEWGRARVLWIGLEPDDKLRDIAEFLNKNLCRAGFGVPDKPFSAHITLCRIKDRIRKDILETVMKEAKEDKLGSSHNFLVNSISVVQSILRQEGSLYKTLKNFSFPS